MHFRLLIDLPRATYSPSGCCHELPRVLEALARVLEYTPDDHGPVLGPDGETCGAYLIVRPSSRDPGLSPIHRS